MDWFTRLKRVIDEYGIQQEDSYNYDKTNFQIKIGGDQWIVTFDPKIPPYIPNVTVRELVTCGETINRNREVLPPLIILPAQIFLRN